ARHALGTPRPCRRSPQSRALGSCLQSTRLQKSLSSARARTDLIALGIHLHTCDPDINGGKRAGSSTYVVKRWYGHRRADCNKKQEIRTEKNTNRPIRNKTAATASNLTVYSSR